MVLFHLFPSRLAFIFLTLNIGESDCCVNPAQPKASEWSGTLGGRSMCENDASWSLNNLSQFDPNKSLLCHLEYLYNHRGKFMVIPYIHMLLILGVYDITEARPNQFKHTRS